MTKYLIKVLKERRDILFKPNGFHDDTVRPRMDYDIELNITPVSYLYLNGKHMKNGVLEIAYSPYSDNIRIRNDDSTSQHRRWTFLSYDGLNEFKRQIDSIFPFLDVQNKPIMTPSTKTKRKHKQTKPNPLLQTMETLLDVIAPISSFDEQTDTPPQPPTPRQMAKS